MSAIYDHTRQSWINGKEALELRIQQLKEEREMVNSERGAEYLRLINSPLKQNQALAAINDRICEAQFALLFG